MGRGGVMTNFETAYCQDILADIHEWSNDGGPGI